MKELGGKTGVLVGLDLPLWVWELILTHWGPIPTLGQLYESEEKHLRWRVKQPICGSLNRMRIRQSLLDTYIHSCRGPGRQFPRRRSDWEVKFRDCGTTPGWGLLLTVERLIEGMWAERLHWEMYVEESFTAMEAKWYRVTRRGWSHHHSLCLPTGQHLQLKSSEAGPSNAWRTELESRDTPKVLL